MNLGEMSWNSDGVWNQRKLEKKIDLKKKLISPYQRQESGFAEYGCVSSLRTSNELLTE
jgi:hypothetical protein